MTRNELFQFITEHNLKEEVKNIYGRPYNSVSTQELHNFVDTYLKQTEESHSAPKLRSRKECFEIIKMGHYETMIKDFYGKPYSSVSTGYLNDFIDDHLMIGADVCASDEGQNPTFVDCAARECLKSLCKVLNLELLAADL